MALYSFDCLDLLFGYMYCFVFQIGLFGLCRFDCLDLISDGLDSLDCFYFFSDLSGLFALFVFFDSLDWFCDAEQSCVCVCLYCLLDLF